MEPSQPFFSFKEQFIFIYDVILESIKSGETELNGCNYKSYINKLTNNVDENGLRFIEKQFQVRIAIPGDFPFILFDWPSCFSVDHRVQTKRLSLFVCTNAL